jgi:hypothetical protein
MDYIFGFQESKAKPVSNNFDSKAFLQFGRLIFKRLTITLLLGSAPVFKDGDSADAARQQ